MSRIKVLIFELCNQCTEPVHAKGLCRTHHQALILGRPLKAKGHRAPRDSDSVLWTDKPGYRAIHSRLRKLRGRAANYTCSCGGPARDWALKPDLDSYQFDRGQRYSYDLDDYSPKCRSCHVRMDHAARKAAAA